MPGLSFLNKKQWHTSTIQNVEKVWLAEEKQKADKRRAEEQQKKLEEERQIQELKRYNAGNTTSSLGSLSYRLQADAGLISKAHLERLDWMYENPAAIHGKLSEEAAEDYLLGNKVATTDHQKGVEQVKKLEEKEAVGA